MPRPRLSIRSLMVLVILVAVWLFILVQSRTYRQRYPTRSDFLDPVSTPP